MGRASAVLGLLALVALAARARSLPLGVAQEYIWHVIIQIFIWSFVGNAWSLMGRFGLVSLGHGAFLGVGAYTTVLLWNFFGMTPWIGAALARRCSPSRCALVVAYPCSRFQVVGHYFGLVTLAVGEVIRLLIVAERDWTGGSLGVTLKTGGTASGLWTLQFADKRVFYYVGMAGLALRPLGVVARGPQHGPLGHGGHRRGRDRGGLGGHPRHALQDGHHRAVGRR